MYKLQEEESFFFLEFITLRPVFWIFYFRTWYPQSDPFPDFFTFRMNWALRERTILQGIFSLCNQGSGHSLFRTSAISLDAVIIGKWGLWVFLWGEKLQSKDLILTNWILFFLWSHFFYFFILKEKARNIPLIHLLRLLVLIAFTVRFIKWDSFHVFRMGIVSVGKAALRMGE